MLILTDDQDEGATAPSPHPLGRGTLVDPNGREPIQIGHHTSWRSTPANDWSGRPRTNYDGSTRQPVFYFPVTLRGALLGYLYASVTHNSAGFLRNLPKEMPEDPFDDPSLEAGEIWGERLEVAYKQGLSAQLAVHGLVGAPEDPESGGIAADAAQGHAESLESLNQLLNPGGPP